MVSLEEAVKIIEKQVIPLESEEVNIMDAMNRVLSDDVYSTQNIPPFDKAAMDGYACRKEDLFNILEIVDFIPAGHVSNISGVLRGTCVKIMTGAPVPKGADIVFMKEYVEIIDEKHVRYTGNSLNSNICMTGEDLKVNDLVLEKGTLIQSSHISVLSSLGIGKIKVSKQPVIAVLSTGSELAEPGTDLKDGQIFNSNGNQLVNRLRQLGFDVTYGGIVIDEYNNLKNRITELLNNHDVILLSGGVSVGDLDLVPQVITDMGFKVHLTELSTKPGKHNLFATNNGKYVLGLPGNPVSSYVQLEVVGRILLNRLMGGNWNPIRILSKLSQPVSRKKFDRLEFIPVSFNDNGEIIQLSYHGSAHMHAMTNAQALLEIPSGVKQLSTSDKIYVRPIQ